MSILGISAFTHDVAIALVSEREPLLLLEEERFTRQRHQDGFVFFGSPPANALQEALAVDPIPAIIAHGIELDFSARQYNLPQIRLIELARSLDPDLGRSRFHNHHLCHAASAFYTSSFEQAYVLTLDSRGDGVSCAVYSGAGATLTKIFEAPARSSLCAVYSYAAELLGLGRRQEGSLMALAGYGKRADLLPGLFTWTGHAFVIGNTSSLEQLCASSDTFAKRADAALSVQRSFEQVVLGLIQDVCSDLTTRRLALAGGGFLNCTLVQAIADSGRWDEIHVCPAPGDSGVALGAALLSLENPDLFRLPHVLLGSNYSSEEVRRGLEDYGLNAEKTSADEIAHLLHRGQIGAIFSGRMEFGPRALGNRSIVADPRRSESKAAINRIKGRHEWRPVAPSILHDRGADWLERYALSPFMCRAFRFLPERQPLVPAVCHADGTARIQSVTPEPGFFFSQVLASFHALTDVPLLCNTSFNVKEPIVRTPSDALRTFFSSPLDFLYLEGWLLTKHNNHEVGRPP